MPSCKPVTCTNCGGHGHVFKKCDRPTTSCGVICVRHTEGSLRFLVVQRKDSFAFVEFMRGKYRLSDADYLRTLFRGMTRSERDGVQCLEFYELWAQLWNGFSKSRNKHEYENARCKFTSLREGVHINGRPCNIAVLIKTTVGRDSPEWGFPKGRRESGSESDLECALREMREETGIRPNQIAIDGRVYDETFWGTNGIQYTHVYYIAFLKDQLARIDNCDREIRQATWVSTEKLMELVGNTPTRASIIKDVIHQGGREK